MTAKKTPLPAKLRPMPFWAWNGTLAADEIRSQIRDMKRMGFGGFFIHSRYGLETAYLGEKWFDCVRAAIDEAQKQGILPWLYDEDRWPSGSAGGEVTRSHPEYAFPFGAKLLFSCAEMPDFTFGVEICRMCG